MYNTGSLCYRNFVFDCAVVQSFKITNLMTAVQLRFTFRNVILINNVLFLFQGFFEDVFNQDLCTNLWLSFHDMT